MLTSHARNTTTHLCNSLHIGIMPPSKSNGFLIKQKSMITNWEYIFVGLGTPFTLKKIVMFVSLLTGRIRSKN